MKVIQNALDMLKRKKENNENIKETVEKITENENSETGSFSLEYSESDLKKQRRRYYRIPANWTMHFKIIKPDTEFKNAQKRWIADKIFESEQGRLKMKTVDVGMGGFKSTISKHFPKGMGIDCIIEINGRKVMTESGGIVIGKVVDCTPNPEKYDYFDVRVKFINMCDETREIVMNKLMLESGG